MNYGELIEVGEFLRGYKECKKFKIVNKKSTDIDYKNILYKSILKLKNNEKGSNSFKEMECFAEKIKTLPNLNKEIKGYEEAPWEAPILMEMLMLSYGRKMFSLQLEYIAKLHNDINLLNISKNLYKASIEWSSIRGILAKAYYVRNKKYIERSSDKIVEVSKFEENIFNSFMKYYRNENNLQLIQNEKISRINRKFNSYTFVNLNKYFNNKGFEIGLSSNHKADLTGTGAFFLNSGFLNDKNLIVNNMQFVIDNINSNRNDNIECEGQNIIIEKNKYSSIMILCCAEWGSFIENIVFRTVDGNLYNIDIGVTDWFSQAQFGEEIAWQGRGAETIKGKTTEILVEVKLFAKEYFIEIEEEIDCIILPKCNNIHIFAITLTKSV